MGPMVTMTNWEGKWEKKIVKNVVVAAERRIKRDGEWDGGMGGEGRCEDGKSGRMKKEKERE